MSGGCVGALQTEKTAYYTWATLSTVSPCRMRKSCIGIWTCDVVLGGGGVYLGGRVVVENWRELQGGLDQ